MIPLLPKILLVDDEDLFRETFRLKLEGWGYSVVTATARSEVATMIDDSVDVVLMDKNLAGPDGPEGGLDELLLVRARLPFARIVLLTGYATELSIERAFASGADDYWVKEAVFYPLARQRLKLFADEWRGDSRRQNNPVLESRIVEGWKAVGSERRPERRGKLLEGFMRDLFSSVRGLDNIRTNASTRYEEIDLFIRNESPDAFWSKESPYWLAECKNWEKPVGKNELLAFMSKLEKRFGRASLGFLIAPKGFAKTVAHEIQAERKGGALVILMDRDHIEAMIAAKDRGEYLKTLHQRAAMGAG